MSLKRMAMKMAIAFAAAKGYEAFRARGGMAGVRDMLAQGSGGTDRAPGGMGAPRAGGGSGGLGGLMGALGGGSGGAMAGGGLGGLLGALGGGGTGRTGTGGGTGSMGGAGSMGGMAGLLGGLAAMAGGGASRMPDDPEKRMRMAEEGPTDEATAAIMVRAIGQAVRADGEIDATERAVLDEIVGEAETDADRAAIDRALSEPVDPDGLARDTPRGHESEVYAAALTAIDPEHPRETDFLRRFAVALRLDPAEVARLHDVAGKPG